MKVNPTDTFIQIIDRAVADAYRRGGANLVCRPGCSQCCVGVFPIAHQDAFRLREGLALASPAIVAAIRQRTESSLQRLDPWFPGDLATGILHQSYEDTILFEEYANNEPCPVLNPETGTCDLYDHRPVLCRTFGPPMSTAGDDGEVNLGTCELCFTHASTDEIVAAQLDPKLPIAEEAANLAFDEAHGLHGETLVAYALRGM